MLWGALWRALLGSSCFITELRGKRWSLLSSVGCCSTEKDIQSSGSHLATRLRMKPPYGSEKSHREPRNHREVSPEIILLHILILCCSVTKSCLTLCHPMDCSMPASSVLHYLPEFAQIHVLWISDTPNHLILRCSLLLLPSVFPSIRVFSVIQLFTSGGQSVGASTSASVHPRSSKGWFPLVLTGFTP